MNNYRTGATIFYFLATYIGALTFLYTCWLMMYARHLNTPEAKLGDFTFQIMTRMTAISLILTMAWDIQHKKFEVLIGATAKCMACCAFLTLVNTTYCFMDIFFAGNTIGTAIDAGIDAFSNWSYGFVYFGFYCLWVIFYFFAVAQKNRELLEEKN